MASDTWKRLEDHSSDLALCSDVNGLVLRYHPIKVTEYHQEGELVDVAEVDIAVTATFNLHGVNNEMTETEIGRGWRFIIYGQPVASPSSSYASDW